MEKFKIEHLSPSGLRTLDDCPRKFEWNYIYRLQRRGENLSQAFGKAGHLGLGAYYKNKRDIDKGLETFRQAWLPFEGKDEKEILTMIKGEELIRAYHAQFGAMEEVEYEVIGGESEVEIMLEGIPIPILGLMDLLLRNKETGELSVMEWKFTKSSWGFVTRPNLQVVTYALLASKLGKQLVRRILFHLNGIHKTSVDGMVQPKKKSDSPRSVFSRDIIDLDPWDFEEWERDVRLKWEEIRYYEHIEYWPKRTGSCGDWGGCEFVPLCIAPPGQREMFVESNFDIKKEVEKE